MQCSGLIPPSFEESIGGTRSIVSYNLAAAARALAIARTTSKPYRATDRKTIHLQVREPETQVQRSRLESRGRMSQRSLGHLKENQRSKRATCVKRRRTVTAVYERRSEVKRCENNETRKFHEIDIEQKRMPTKCISSKLTEQKDCPSPTSPHPNLQIVPTGAVNMQIIQGRQDFLRSEGLSSPDS